MLRAQPSTFSSPTVSLIACNILVHAFVFVALCSAPAVALHPLMAQLMSWIFSLGLRDVSQGRGSQGPAQRGCD